MLREDVQNRLGSLIQLTGELGLLEEVAATIVAGRGHMILDLFDHWSGQ